MRCLGGVVFNDLNKVLVTAAWGYTESSPTPQPRQDIEEASAMPASKRSTAGSTPVRRSARKVKTPQRLVAGVPGNWTTAELAVPSEPQAAGAGSDEDGVGAGYRGRGRGARPAGPARPKPDRKRRNSYSAVTGVVEALFRAPPAPRGTPRPGTCSRPCAARSELRVFTCSLSSVRARARACQGPSGDPDPPRIAPTSISPAFSTQPTGTS